MFTRKRSEEKTQKWRCVITFYSAFRRAFCVGNPRADGDAKVCEIQCSMHFRRLGVHTTTTPSPRTCVQPSLSSILLRFYRLHGNAAVERF